MIFFLFCLFPLINLVLAARTEANLMCAAFGSVLTSSEYLNANAIVAYCRGIKHNRKLRNSVVKINVATVKNEEMDFSELTAEIPPNPIKGGAEVPRDKYKEHGYLYVVLNAVKTQNDPTVYATAKDFFGLKYDTNIDLPEDILGGTAPATVLVRGKNIPQNFFKNSGQVYGSVVKIPIDFRQINSWANLNQALGNLKITFTRNAKALKTEKKFVKRNWFLRKVAAATIEGAKKFNLNSMGLQLTIFITGELRPAPTNHKVNGLAGEIIIHRNEYAMPSLAPIERHIIESQDLKSYGGLDSESLLSSNSLSLNSLNSNPLSSNSYGSLNPDPLKSSGNSISPRAIAAQFNSGSLSNSHKSYEKHSEDEESDYMSENSLDD